MQMIKFIVVVREIGRLKPDYSLEIEAPALPGVGSYLSVERPDSTYGHTEDLGRRLISPQPQPH